MKKILYTTLCALLFSTAAWCQLPKSALDYMLQKPRVAKKYKNKTFGDHLFVDFGVGPTFSFGGGNGKFFHMSTPSAMGSFMIGDWITPEHAVRLGFSAGDYQLGKAHSKFIGGSLDYLLNITALSQRTYDVRKAFELYGVAGVELLYSRQSGKNTHAVAGHLGLQGNLRIDDCLHFFVEPRIGLYQDDLYHIDTWRGYRPAASILAGFGYSLRSGDSRSHIPSPYHNVYDGLFVSAAAGGGAFLHSNFSDSRNYKGIKAAVSVGKWFNPYSAIRLTANIFSFQRPAQAKMKGIGGQIDYLFNMSNLFGGYSTDRMFEFNGVVGFDLNYTNNYLRKKGFQFSPGIGGGFQANLFLNKHHNFAFFLEPRLDINGRKFIQDMNTVRKMDITATMLAGLTLYRAPSDVNIHKVNLGYPNVGWYDHLFLEMGGGIQSVMLANALSHPRANWGPMAYLGAGKWFDATSGVRLSGVAGKYKENGSSWRNYLSVGADYLWNISNAFVGYVPDRKVEFIASAGLDLAGRSGRDKLFVGGGAGIQALWHLNKMVGLFIEPQFRLYNNNFAKGNIRYFHNDGMGSVMAGVHIDMSGYRASSYQKDFEGFEHKAFVSMAGGVVFKPFHANIGNLYGPTARISLGRWYTPLSAWRLSLSGATWKRSNHHYARASVNADYLFDLTTLSMGFNPKRAISLRALAGADLSLDYHTRTTYLTPALHIGGQFAVRLSPSWEVYVEPQLGRDLWNTEKGRSNKLDGKMLLGVTHSLLGTSKAGRAGTIEGYHNFFSLGGGIGLNSETVAANPPIHRKWTFDTHLTYGHWVNAVSGFRIGFADEFIQKMHTNNRQILTAHLDYMLNFNSLMNNGQQTDNTVTFIGNLGVSGNSGVSEGSKPRLAPGLWTSLQADFKLSKRVSLYLEPTVNIMGTNILKNTDHPFEFSSRLNVGTKINF